MVKREIAFKKCYVEDIFFMFERSAFWKLDFIFFRNSINTDMIIILSMILKIPSNTFRSYFK